MGEKPYTYPEAIELIKEWLPLTEGVSFDNDHVYRQFNVYTADEKHHFAQALSNFKRKGLLEGDKGRFRFVNREIEPLDWVEADTGNILDIRWPYGWGDRTSFGFNDNLTLYPNSIVVAAGESNEGKSALMFNILALNLDKWEEKGIRYFTNEMGKEELKDRLAPFAGYYELTDDFGSPRFEAAERYDNYQDVIIPGGLNIIDYLDPGENSYMIGQQINAIKKTLRGGVAFIAIQKRRGAEYGTGGQYSEHRARIVFHIGKNLLTVVKAKKCRKENLNGQKFSFRIKNNGSQFYDIKPYVEEENG